MLGEAVGPSQQSVQAAAISGNTAGTMARGAGASALTMAAMGAGVGMMFGPMGVAVGAAAGGLVGLAQGLTQTSKDIREAKLGQAVQGLGDMLTAAANNVRTGGVAGLDPAALQKELGTALGEAETKTNEATSRSWLNPARWHSSLFGGSVSGMEAGDIAAIRTKETRAALGGQGGAMVALLSRQADELGRNNPTGTPEELAARMRDGAASGPLLQAVAPIRGESLDKAIKEFADSIRAAQRQFRVQREVEGGRLAAEKSAAALSRLTDAVTNAAGSVARFETSMTVLGAVFNGSGGPGRVTALGGFNTLGTGTGVEFRQSAGAVGAVLGSGGDGFMRSADAADRLARVMPSVLASIGSSTLGPDESYGKKTRDLLYAQLLPGMDEAGRQRALTADPQLAAAVEAAVGGVARIQADSENDGGIQRRIQQDAGRVATEVTEAFAGPLREAGERMAKAVEEQANKYAEGLTQARNMLAAAGESRDRAGEMRLGTSRVRAEFEADRTGRTASGILSLDELNAPFRDRQARLAGGIGEDPTALAARLREVTDQIAQATQARDEALRTRDASGTSRESFTAAAGNLDRLIGTSNNLQQALRNLANASEWAAGLQEKLTAANANRDGRLGYAEKYLFADPEGRARMQRGQQLAIGLDRGRLNFNGLSVDEQRLAVETLGDFGQTRLASGRTAAGLRQQLIGGMNGVTDAAQEADRRGLQDQIVGVFQTAETAQRALAGFQQDVHQRFIGDLTRLQEQFFARLAVNFAAEQLSAARNGLASAEAARGRLRGEEAQRGVLGRIGVTGQAGLAGLRNAQGEVDTFLSSTRRLRDLEGAGTAAAGTREEVARTLETMGVELRGSPVTEAKTNQLRSLLAGRGLQNLSAGGQETALSYVADQVHGYYGTPDGLLAWNMQKDDTKTAFIMRAVEEGLRRGRDQTASEVSGVRDRAAETLRARGVNTDALAGLGDGDQASLREALRSSATDLGTLDQRIRENANALTTFRTALGNAERSLAEAGSRETAGSAPGTVPIRRADGGFTPRGTDTVPAMLTPGEFVINRASTQANLALLRHINSAKGPVQYREDGGVIKKVAEGYLWGVDKMNKAGNWVSSFFADSGPVYLAGGGLAERLRDAERASDIAEVARARGASVIGGSGPVVLPGMDQGNANLRAALRRREALLRRRLEQQARRPRQITPEEALAANRAMNARAMGFSQALARSGMDDGQLGAAMGSVAQLRDFENRQFMGRWGSATAGLRMRDTEAWRVGGGLRQENAANPETREAARRIRAVYAADARRPTPRRIVPVGLPGNGSFYATGGMVGGNRSGDTIPAMLTPGEYVFSRPAVAAFGAANLDRVHRFAAGGFVPGASAGPGPSGQLGLSQEARAAMDSFAGHSKELGAALTGFATPANLLTQALHGFSGGVDKFAGAVDRIPREIDLQTRGTVEVVVTGPTSSARPGALWASSSPAT